MLKTILSLIELAKAQGKFCVSMSVPYHWFHDLWRELHEDPGSGVPPYCDVHGVRVYPGYYALLMEFSNR